MLVSYVGMHAYMYARAHICMYLHMFMLTWKRNIQPPTSNFDSRILGRTLAEQDRTRIAEQLNEAILATTQSF